MSTLSIHNLQERLTDAFCEAHVAMYGTGDHTLTKEMTSIHEAGHAVIYRLMGIEPFAEITQDVDGYWVGFCGLDRSFKMVSDSVNEYMAADIITNMSGYTAEKELTSKYCLSSSGIDKAKAQTATVLLAKILSIGPEILFLACQKFTDDIINEYSDSVISLARRLEKEEYLSSEIVCKMLNYNPLFDGHVGLGNHVLQKYFL